MKIREKDIYILDEYQKKPYLSIRTLAKTLNLTKDKVFRTVKKFKEELGLSFDHWVNLGELSLTPFFLLIQSSFKKVNKAIKSLINPYLLNITVTLGGEGVFILAKYSLPPKINLKPLLGLSKSWNWHLRQYGLKIIYEGARFSFQFFDLNEQSWLVNWLYWGLMIKEALIGKEMSEVYPKYRIFKHTNEQYQE
ncbi:MAG: winged helix-turn-helix domain-containing protein, partial [Candidatus Odinarchaeia archaeon]